MKCRSCARALDDDARFCPGCGLAVSSTCVSCGASLDDDARFCRHCGQAVASSDDGVAIPCTACGTELEAGDRFCRRCGEPALHPDASAIDDSPATQQQTMREMGRERKVATLLFADIVGFTGLNEAHDPELVSGLVSSAFERLSQEVRRYEGTIEKFAGDALLAVFGVPVIHEDDPERAVRAALEMQAAAGQIEADQADGPDLRLRIGIATGEVLADQARASSERDLFVTGDAVNVAARLQAAADPGAVVVGSTTYASTRDAIEYEELAPVVLKGKELPVAAWQAVSVKAGRGGRRARLGLQAPMVGRDAELGLLKEMVRRTVEEAKPHLVTVVGSAGVGKSRLTWELEKYLDGLPDVFHWRKGRCLAYSGPSFGPIADVIRADSRIADDDAPAAAREKLTGRMVELGLDTDDALLVGALEAVLAIGDGRDQARDRLFESWRRYLDAIAAVAPLVLVMEDIHWADDGILGFLDFLARWSEGAIVIICLARHELLEKRSTWGGGLPNATAIVLEPLGTVSSAAMMDGLLDGGVPTPLASRVIELAEGNPLFVEEMVRMLVDRGVLRFSEGRWELAGAMDEVEIPDSVQAVLAARLDSLPPEEKRIAQDAAVVGRVFWDVIVAHLAGSGRDPIDELIRRLRVKDLVVQRSPSSLADASEYGFRHALIRDVAYDSLPKRDRSRLHLDIARWAEAELADRIDEFSELIASHLRAALAYEEEFASDAAGLRVTREITYDAARRAARRAMAMSQLDVASSWMRLALDLAWKLDLPPRTMARLTLEFVEVAFQTAVPEESDRALARAIEALEAMDIETADDRDLLARLRDQRGYSRFELDDLDGSRKLVRAALAELETGPPTEARAKLLTRLGWTYWRAGPIADAVPLLQRAIAEAEACGSAVTYRWATHDLGTAQAMLGRLDEGIALLERSHALATEAEDRSLLMRCYINLPATREARGDPTEELIAITEEGLQIARRSASSQFITWLAANEADFLFDAGRFAEAEAHQREAIFHSEAISAQHLASKHSGLALVHLLRGDPEAARHEQDTAEGLGPVSEPQMAWASPLSVAVLTWADDPQGASTTLASWASTHIDGPGSAYELTITLARMALRLGDSGLMAESLRLAGIAQIPTRSPRNRAQRRWLEALASEDHQAVESSAITLEELGRRRHAADAWADAALIASRGGASSEAGRRAAALLRDMDMHPFLGPLPESRWVEAKSR